MVPRPPQVVRACVLLSEVVFTASDVRPSDPAFFCRDYLLLFSLFLIRVEKAENNFGRNPTPYIDAHDVWDATTERSLSILMFSP